MSIGALMGWKRYALSMGVGVVVAVIPTRWYYQAKSADVRAGQAESVAESQRFAREILERRISEVGAINDRNAKAEWAAYGGMRNAQIEDNGLRADVDSGRKRLHVAASCPAPTSGVPETGTTASVGNGTRAELDPAARRDYFALRSGIRLMKAQLDACQARFN